MNQKLAEVNSPTTSFSSPLDGMVGLPRKRLRDMRKRDVFSTLLSLFGSTFGFGCLALSATVGPTGPGTWLILFALAVAVNFITFESLIYFADKLGLVNFVEISQLIGGKKTKNVILGLFFVTNVGILLSALTVINGQICAVVASFGVTNQFFVNPKYLIWIIVPAIAVFPILIKRKLTDVAFVTFISLAAAFFMIVFLFITLGGVNTASSYAIIPGKEPSVLYAIPGTYAYIFFAFLCQPNLMGIYNELAVRTVSNMRKIYTIHIALFSFIYICISIFGYLIFHGNPMTDEKNVLFHFPDKKSFMLRIANLFMMLTSLNSFAFGFKPVKDAILSIFEKDPEEEGVEVVEVEAPEEDVVVVKEKSDFEPLNLTVTLALLGSLIIGACILVLGEIPFNKILGKLSDYVIPILIVFIPLYAYVKQKKALYVYGVLAMAAIFYLWSIVLEFVPEPKPQK